MRQCLQATVEKPIEIEDISIETGKLSKWIIYPAEVNQGIVFVRETETGKTVRIPANHNKVYHCNGFVRLGHLIGVNGVEHLLSIFHGVGITNAEILCKNEFPPENTKKFAKVLYDSKRIQKERVEYFKFPNQIHHYNTHVVEVEESEDFKITCFFDFDSPFIREELKYCITVTPESYVDKISSARTFCNKSFLENLQNNNRALGASNINCLILPDEYDESFHIDRNEIVLHKILDFIGDIFLIGKPVLGDFTLRNPNHTTSYLLNRENDNNAGVLFKPKDKCY